jgi:MFS superfamily sulfate permease-like transporter
MLIGVGFRLASPKEFGHMYKIGFEQLLVFVSTIVVTLATDLLIGMAAGIVVKLIVQQFFGVPRKNIFKFSIEKIGNHHWNISGAAVFSNWMGFQKEFEKFNKSENLTINFENCSVVDHTVMENLHHLEMEFHEHGGQLKMEGIHELTPTSKQNHPLSARRKVKG